MEQRKGTVHVRFGDRGRGVHVGTVEGAGVGETEQGEALDHFDFEQFERTDDARVAGGGARNKTLMKMLAARLAPASVATADEAGWSADALEAQAFAYLAVRALRGLPPTFPTTTGVKAHMGGGIVAAPDN